MHMPPVRCRDPPAAAGCGTWSQATAVEIWHTALNSRGSLFDGPDTLLCRSVVSRERRAQALRRNCDCWALHQLIRGPAVEFLYRQDRPAHCDAGRDGGSCHPEDPRQPRRGGPAIGGICPRNQQDRVRPDPDFYGGQRAIPQQSDRSPWRAPRRRCRRCSRILGHGARRRRRNWRGNNKKNRLPSSHGARPVFFSCAHGAAQRG